MSKARTKAQNTKALAVGVADSLFAYAPASVQPYLKKLEPVFEALGTAINATGPAVDFLSNAYAKAAAFLAPYDPQYIFPMIVGLLMMFFGGYFMLTIACIEAYRLSGWDTTKQYLLQIHQNFLKVKEASDKDDKVDEDQDGIADVLQVSEKELVTRKLKLFFGSCDPSQVASAFGGIYTGFLTVLATLQLQLARSLALGVSVGDALTRPATRLLTPLLQAVIPPNFQNWNDVIIRSLCKFIGVSIAMYLQRFLAAVHTALRGAQIFIEAFAVYATRRGYPTLSEGYWEEGFAVIATALGLWLQLSSGFSLPWILSIFLFPVITLEGVLAACLAQ